MTSSTDAATRRLLVTGAPSAHPLARMLAADPRLLSCGDLPGLAELDPAALAPALAHVQVVHLHGGVEGVPPARLRAVVDGLHATDTRVVASLGELRARDERDRCVHDERIRTLLEHADVTTTLTGAAARECTARFGVTPVVVPRLGLVPDDRTAPPPRPRDVPQAIGIALTHQHARSAVDESLEAIADLLADDGDVVVEVHVLDELAGAFGPALRRLPVSPRVAVRTEGWMRDDRLWDWVAGLDVLVLPLRWATHSPWVGIGRDLGTAVVGPATGGLRELGLTAGWTVEQDDAVAPASIRAAIDVARALAPRHLAAPRSRVRDRAEVGDAHATLYGLVAGWSPDEARGIG